VNNLYLIYGRSGVAGKSTVNGVLKSGVKIIHTGLYSFLNIAYVDINHGYKRRLD